MFDAGWSKRDLRHAVLTASLFNVVNGLQELHRLKGTATLQAVQGDGPSHNVIRTTSGIRFSDFEDVSLGPVEWDLAMLGPEAVAEYDDAATALGLRRTDPQVQRLMDTARTLQFISAATLVPQLPVLAEGLAPVIEQWRRAL